MFSCSRLLDTLCRHSRIYVYQEYAHHTIIRTWHFTSLLLSYDIYIVFWDFTQASAPSLQSSGLQSSYIVPYSTYSGRRQYLWWPEKIQQFKLIDSAPATVGTISGHYRYYTVLYRMSIDRIGLGADASVKYHRTILVSIL